MYSSHSVWPRRRASRYITSFCAARCQLPVKISAPECFRRIQSKLSHITNLTPMTEYSASASSHQRYLETQNRTAHWVESTASTGESFSPTQRSASSSHTRAHSALGLPYPGSTSLISPSPLPSGSVYDDAQQHRFQNQSSLPAEYLYSHSKSPSLTPSDSISQINSHLHHHARSPHSHSHSNSHRHSHPHQQFSTPTPTPMLAAYPAPHSFYGYPTHPQTQVRAKNIIIIHGRRGRAPRVVVSSYTKQRKFDPQTLRG
ncbi:hypothetical protein R3P38DRAFT_3153609 [Favolaschia claudopus]|uniref:Uncharacterized protein n=1 Tax=Favolaschia claudopus TaxID=2862362 RepID=A0AAV9Z083_9AGAR